MSSNIEDGEIVEREKGGWEEGDRGDKQLSKGQKRKVS
jgi:hypothetical protein